MALNVALPELKHKWIKLYDTIEQQQEEETDWQNNYEECCVSIVKASNATDFIKEYQYSVRTTNNDNEKKGQYSTKETPHYWAGLEIAWGYFGWEYNDYEYNEETLRGGNFFKKIACNEVISIPDGTKLQHINNFFGSQDGIRRVRSFDVNNIISAENLVGFTNNEIYNNFREIIVDIDNWPNVVNAKGMFQNGKWTFNDNEIVIDSTSYHIVKLPKAKDCSYLFYLSKPQMIDNYCVPIIPNAEKLDYAFYNRKFDTIDPENKIKAAVTYDKCVSAIGMLAASDNPPSYISCKCIINFPIVKDLSYFAKNRFNNSYNNITINAPIVENISYASSGGEKALVIDSNNLLCAKGFVSNFKLEPRVSFEPDFVSDYLIKHNKVTCWDEYFANYAYQTDGKNSNHFTFDISDYDQEDNVTVKDFFSNGNIPFQIYVKFIGHNKVVYDYFMNNSNAFIFHLNTSMEDGLSYRYCFKNSYLYFDTEEYGVSKQPLINLKDNIDYSFCWQGCTIKGEVDTRCAENVIPLSTYNYLDEAIISSINPNFNWKQLPNVNLNFHVGEENVINELFDFEVTNNTSDFRFGEDYIGYKDFTIGEKFNYKEIKTQTINICVPNRNYAYNNPNNSISTYYIINNNNLINENNVIFNIKDLPKIEDVEYGMPVHTQKIVIQSTSMKNLTIRGEWYVNGEDTFYGVLINIPSLVNLDIQLERSSWRDTIEINNDILEGFLVRHFNGTINITSTKINIDNLKQSIDWWIEESTTLYQLTIKQSVYNQLDETYQTKLIGRCNVLNIIQ